MTSIFLDNRYTRWYYAIVNSRPDRTASDDYTETHHIVPESFYIERTREGPAGWLVGNPDAADNLVALTGREHGLCHWLLTKMTEGVALIKCRQAFDMMGMGASHQERGMSRLTCRAFERNRIKVAADRSDRMKIDNPMDNPESRAKVGDSKRGVKRAPFSQEWLDKLAESNQGEKNGMYGKTHSEETKALQSNMAERYGWITDGNTNQRVLKTDLADWLRKGWEVGRTLLPTGERPKTECPHCGTLSAANTYARFHGDKCKHKK